MQFWQMLRWAPPRCFRLSDVVELRSSTQDWPQSRVTHNVFSVNRPKKILCDCSNRPEWVSSHQRLDYAYVPLPYGNRWRRKIHAADSWNMGLTAGRKRACLLLPSTTDNANVKHLTKHDLSRLRCFHIAQKWWPYLLGKTWPIHQL